jgi:23S rRNA (adenine2030-N6)-methyltransferase
MNYDHAYHAGSFSDVFKHLILMQIITLMIKKDKALCYLETQAGRGKYDLFSEAAQKTQEKCYGIDKIMSSIDKAPIGLIQQYQALVIQSGYPRYYPGSPVIAQRMLRADDRKVFLEKHPDIARLLQHSVYPDKKTVVYAQDGYAGIKAFLPPLERRGFIFIDPAFEDPLEWDLVCRALTQGIKRFSQGVYAIWYPIKDLASAQNFLKAIKRLCLKKVLFIECDVYSREAYLGLSGSGMVIINPPWQFEEEVGKWLPWVWKCLASPKARLPTIQAL